MNKKVTATTRNAEIRDYFDSRRQAKAIHNNNMRVTSKAFGFTTDNQEVIKHINRGEVLYEVANSYGGGSVLTTTAPSMAWTI